MSDWIAQRKLFHELGVLDYISLDEAFSKAMGLEKAGKVSGLPRGVVRRARDIFSAKCNGSIL